MTGSPAAFCLYDAPDTDLCMLVLEAVRGACTSLNC